MKECPLPDFIRLSKKKLKLVEIKPPLEAYHFYIPLVEEKEEELIGHAW
jgi:hypothetical protein